MSFYKWSQTAADNDVADSTVNYREGQAPSSLNNAGRGMMAALAKYRDDMSGNLVLGGTATAYTVTTNQAHTVLTDGYSFLARVNVTSLVDPTLAVDGLTAKQIRTYYGVNIPVGGLIAGGIYHFTYDATDGAWIAQNAAGAVSTPIGAVFDFAGATAPPLFLLCYGQAISRTTYAALFAVISTTYGVGDGATTFNVPDLRGRVVAGQDDMGGSSANRLTAAGSGLDGDVIGGAGGLETHTLTEAQLAAHTHSVSGTTSSDGLHAHSYRAETTGGQDNDSSGGIMLSGGGDTTYTEYTGTANNTAGQAIGGGGTHDHDVTGTAAAAGSSTAHNNVQPTLILNKCMFAGV